MQIFTEAKGLIMERLQLMYDVSVESRAILNRKNKSIVMSQYSVVS